MKRWNWKHWTLAAVVLSGLFAGAVLAQMPWMGGGWGGPTARVQTGARGPGFGPMMGPGWGMPMMGPGPAFRSGAGPRGGGPGLCPWGGPAWGAGPRGLHGRWHSRAGFFGRGGRGFARGYAGAFSFVGQVETQVRELEDGAELIVTAEDPQAAAAIQLHFSRLQQRLTAGLPYRIWDPLFADLYLYRDAIQVTVENRPDGVRLVERASEPEAVALVQEHVRVLADFLDRGPVEMWQTHPSPLREE